MPTQITRWVFCRTSFEALHRWPEAPDAVNFLRNPHRHMFQLEVQIEVPHSDRAIEFILLKREVDTWVRGLPLDLLSKSCEMIAEDLYADLIQEYGEDRRYKITVGEDLLENGATLEFAPAPVLKVTQVEMKLDPKELE